MENKKSIGTTVLIIILLLVTVAALILATYAWAKYTSTGNGEATAQVAKWNVTVNADTTKFQQTYTHVLNDRIAPGTSGQLDATVNVGEDTEVDVDYKISIEDIEVTYVDETVQGTPAIPTNMIFKDSQGNTINHADLTVGKEIASGTVEAGTGNATAKTVLSWEWPYETGDKVGDSDINTGDAQDTIDGQNPVKITVTYKVDAWQVEPTV